MSNLRDRIGDLSVAEKLELLDVLWESLEFDAHLLTDVQRAELDRRVALYEQDPADIVLYEQDPADIVPWEQLRSELSSRQ
jgi:putative addiction module component (TIGR02574 family)